MGQDGVLSAQKRPGALPTTATDAMNGDARIRANPQVPRGRQISRTFNNIKITILCGFVTILVLRGTIGVGNLASSDAEVENSFLIDETNRILDEIRSDKDPDDPEGQSGDRFLSPNETFSLGPKITGWDEQRKVWFDRHPRFPSSVKGKPRVLLVTGSPPTPCENPVGDHYLLKGVKNKIDYCRIHGIEIVYNSANMDREMDGNWAKLPLIRRLMLSHPEIEWIWWMDSDAFFTDMAFEIPLSKYDSHNLVIHGYQDLLFDQKSWTALSTGSFLIRNCQWALDLLDVWAPMGPKGPIREESGKTLTANLKGRPEFEADDQSALIYLLMSEKDQWMDKVFLENSYYLHGYWAGLVDRYEEVMEKYHPGFGDERWPFVTHFVGCKACGSSGDFPVEKCVKSMERAFNFADNQVLNLYGFKHRGLLSPNIKRIRNETTLPLPNVDRYDFRHAKHES
ncbi:PREDICTED: probable xyloglucan 6-xylosyltransferase 5 [Ipomoea nil]|uniref:probable xyloglucan 6-xylosyltransferase 5 n=1 Tax=Ipomoea nil TaxID=35883 RepID=UPI000900FE86|nr:PREDICTED: probable xyloglucan 6-xylosyltransferase 5 [Ipomoea nil]XP_019167064.1 PREDICTED: probable xyloglucan 6-xylosyltransferase 5 [Ipomoea nil]XP_019167065.1 PREDICTED: probable xyloglucan 6-xylosyltransferase 5 [Ipomoea nil]